MKISRELAGVIKALTRILLCQTLLCRLQVMLYTCYWDALSLILVAGYYASGTTGFVFGLCSFVQSCCILLLMSYLV